ncbi:hypothetical protein ACSQ67_016267 [Phaseolus vulgaris]
MKRGSLGDSMVKGMQLEAWRMPGSVIAGEYANNRYLAQMKGMVLLLHGAGHAAARDADLSGVNLMQKRICEYNRGSLMFTW